MTNTLFYQTTFNSPIGELTLCAKEDNLIGIWIKNQKYYADSLKNCSIENREDLKIFRDTRKWLTDYFNGEKKSPYELPLAPIGSGFRQLVWEELCKIPYGETTTYGELSKTIARELGKDKMSAQAVGGAIGHNPISIVIPCHRVVGKNGQLTGYAGGLEIKSKLLQLEKHK